MLDETQKKYLHNAEDICHEIMSDWFREHKNRNDKILIQIEEIRSLIYDVLMINENYYN